MMISEKFYEVQRKCLEPEILKVPLDWLFLKVNILQDKIQSENEEFADFIRSIFKSPFVCFQFCIEIINEAELINSKNFLVSNKAIV